MSDPDMMKPPAVVDEEQAKDIAVWPSNQGGMPALRTMQRMTEATLLDGYRQQYKRHYQPVVNLFNKYDERLKAASQDLHEAIANLGDGLTAEDVARLVDAQTAKWSALISKNAADIAEVGVKATQQVMASAVESLNAVATGAAAAGGEFANAFAGAFNRMTYALTGKNLGYWDAEIYVASAAVFTGYNDTPLGICKPFDGAIKTAVVRTMSATKLVNDQDPKLVLAIIVNGVEKRTVTMAGENQTTIKVDDLGIDINHDEPITLKVKSVQGEYLGLTVNLSGVYL